MHKLIAVFSKIKFDNNNDDIIYIDDNYEFVDNYMINFNNEKLFFDYIITDNITLLKQCGIIIDNNLALVNNVFQTSIENVYAIGDAVISNKSIPEQFKIIIENIYEY